MRPGQIKSTYACLLAKMDRGHGNSLYIQWVREIMNLSKLTSMRKVRDLQVPRGFDTDYVHPSMMPCAVWIGEAPKDQGPRAQPS